MGPGGLNRTIAAGSPGAAWGTVRTVPIRAERSAAAVVSGWPQSLHRGGRLQALALRVSKSLTAASSPGARVDGLEAAHGGERAGRGLGDDSVAFRLLSA